jgi:N-acetylglucosamine malate deacetylase 1
MMKRILVIAPHPDDEVIGCGGTIASYCKQGSEVHVLIVTRGDKLFDQKQVVRARKEALAACNLLGVKKLHFADLPAIKLDTLPQYKINEVLLDFFRQIEPDILFIPFLGDINRDHQIVHKSCMVAARPTLMSLEAIYCYETLSSTNWNSPGLTPQFSPNVFMNITDTIEMKIQALKSYASKIKEYPHECSPESAWAISQYRGGFVNLPHAEAFMCMRQIIT